MKKLIYLLVLMASACELVVEVDQPPFKPSIVLGSFIAPDTTIVVSLSEDRYVLDQVEEFDPITGATVRLFEEDRLIGTLEALNVPDHFAENSGEDGGYYGLDYRPTPGVEYRLEAEKDGYTSVQATDRLPENAPRFEVVSIEQHEFSDTEIEVKIFDEPGRDYYEVLVYLSLNIIEGTYNENTQEWEIDSIWRRTESVRLYTENIAVEEHNTSIFSDRLFDGRAYELDLEGGFYVDQNPNINIGDMDIDLDPVLTIEVRKVSEAYFNFINTSALQRWVDGDPFAEPVQAFSNVENGRGVLGTYVSSKIEIEL